MTLLPFRPRFDYGTDTWEATIPSRIWTPSDGQFGGAGLSASRDGRSYLGARDQILTFGLRHYEAEWPVVLEMLQYGQAWPNVLTFYPDQLITGTSYEVLLWHPRMGERVASAIDSEYQEAREIQIQLRKPSGVTWSDTWFGS